MLKQWAAWPRSIRSLAGIAAAVLGLAIAWALFVPVADWLAHNDVGPVAGSLHETALDNARGRLLTAAAGLLAAGALVFTARNFLLSREGQVTDRYTKAIEQLGSDKLDVRIGGIYALERIARDSARDHPTVMEVLTAFIREHSSESRPLPDPSGQEQQRSSGPDVRAAVTVVRRRNANRDIRPLDLAGADLTGAYLGMHLTGANLSGAHLTGADLNSAKLDGAKLRLADLRDADLQNAHLRDADLTRADLTGARLNRATLSYAHLGGVNLTRAVLVYTDLANSDLAHVILTHAYLTGANLAGAHLTGAHLTEAMLLDAHLTRTDLTQTDFSGATLTNADLTDADLTGANLTGAQLIGANLAGVRWPANTPVPDGWKLDTGSGRLIARDTGAESAEAT